MRTAWEYRAVECGHQFSATEDFSYAIGPLTQTGADCD